MELQIVATWQRAGRQSFAYDMACGSAYGQDSSKVRFRASPSLGSGLNSLALMLDIQVVGYGRRVGVVAFGRVARLGEG